MHCAIVAEIVAETVAATLCNNIVGHRLQRSYLVFVVLLVLRTFTRSKAASTTSIQGGRSLRPVKNKEISTVTRSSLTEGVKG